MPMGRSNCHYLRLFLKIKEVNRVQEQEAALIEQRLVQESQSIRNEIMNLYHEYEYALKQHVSLYRQKGSDRRTN